MVTIETSPHAPTEELPVIAPVRRRWRPRRPLALLIALGFFFGPAGAYVLGVRPQAFENHALAARPSLSDGWKFFPELTSWAVDHLPLREKAVKAYAKGSEKVFGQPPSYYSSNEAPVAGVATGGSATAKSGASTSTGPGAGVVYPQVIQGKNGWLYYGTDISGKCQPARSIADTFARIDRLAAAVQASGRRFVFTVAPDKSTIDPANLPDSYVGQQCAAQRRTAFWNALQATPPTGYLDLRGPLEAEQKKTGPIYRPTDTHWNSRGAAVYTVQLAKRLDPALLKDTHVEDEGTMTLAGDLSPMVGLTSSDTLPNVQVNRPGVTPVGRDTLELPAQNYTAPVTATDATTGAPLFQPKTLILGDSFTMMSRDALGGLFADVSLLHCEAAQASPQVVADSIANSDVVVYEIVERSIGSGVGGLIEDPSLTAIEKTLASHHR